jgi:DNA-binding transcriptional ArsR family regulator
LDRRTIDLIIHPVRLRIMSLLAREQLTTQQIGEFLPDVPTSSIYRHVKLLLDNDLISVAAVHPVQGIEEKVYALKVPPYVSDPADLADYTKEEHLQLFTVIITELLHSYTAYLEHTPHVDLGADRVGFTSMNFYATPEEMDDLARDLNTALAPYAVKEPAPGRELRKIAVIGHPIRKRPNPD